MSPVIMAEDTLISPPLQQLSLNTDIAAMRQLKRLDKISKKIKGQLHLNSPQKTKSGLLTLPREIRDLIYKFYFSGTVFNLLYSEQYLFPLCELLPRKFPLLSVCRSIRQEALHIFFLHVCFVIRESRDLTSLHSQMIPERLFPGLFIPTITCLRLQESFEPVYGWWGRRNLGLISKSWEEFTDFVVRCSNLREVQIVAREPYNSEIVASDPPPNRAIDTLLAFCSLQQKQHLTIRIFIQPREAPERKLLDKFKKLHKHLQAQTREPFNIKILPYRYIGYPELWHTPLDNALDHLIEEIKWLKNGK